MVNRYDVTHAVRLAVAILLFTPSPTRGATPCPECDEVVKRVIPLLPLLPPPIVVLDAKQQPRALKDKMKGVEAFVNTGKSTIYLNSQSAAFQHALRGPGIWDYELAITIWHEMAHLAGADEPEAQRREEALWLEFVVAGKIDSRQGMSYLQLMRKRR
jgi:hypothetical protein